MIFIIIWAISPVVLIPLSIYLFVAKRKYTKELEELKNKIDLSNTEISHLQQRIRNLKEYQTQLKEKAGIDIAAEPNLNSNDEANDEKSLEPAVANDILQESATNDILPESVANEVLSKTVADEKPSLTALDSDLAESIVDDVQSEPVKSSVSAEAVVNSDSKQVKKGLPSGTALFGIGILFVLVAGAIFATTTWQILPAAGKVLTLLGAVAVFFISSFIAEKKFDLRETSITFFLLGSSFLSVINLGIGYFRWFGDFYVLSGDQTFLVVSVSTIILSLCLIIGRKIYNVDLLGMLAYIFLFGSVLLFIRFLTDEISAMILAAGISLVLSLLYVYLRSYNGYRSCISKCVDKISYAFLVVSISILSSKTDIFVGIFILILGLVISFIISVLLDDSGKKMAVLQIYSAVVAFVLPLKVAIGYEYIPAVFVFLGCAYVYSLTFRFIKLSDGKEIGSTLTDILSMILMFFASLSIIAITAEKVSTALIILAVWTIALITFVAFMFLFKENSRRTVRAADFINVDVSLFAISLTGLILYEISSVVAWQLVPVIFALIITVCFELQEQNYASCFSVCTLFFFIENMMDKLFSKKESIILIVSIVLFFVSIVLGRLLYKRIYNANENKKNIDWFAILSFIFIIGITALDGDYISFTCFLLFATYFANAYKRVPDIICRVSLSISAVLVGAALVNWPFFEIKSTFELEWNITAILLVMLAGGFIWNNIERFYSIFASLMVILFSYVYLNDVVNEIEYISVGRTLYVAVLKILFYIIPAVILFVVSQWRKNKIYLIAAGLIIMGTSVFAHFLVVKWLMVIPIAFGIAYTVFLYIKNEKNLLLMPIVQVYVLLAAFDVPKYIYLIVFAFAIVYGFVSYSRVIEKTEFQLSIDWFTITSIVPVAVIASSENEKWFFCSAMMFAAYMLCYYKRIADDRMLNNIILTIASVVMGLSFMKQPFLEISDSWETEWFLLFAWIVIIFNIVYVYRDYDNDKKHIVLYCFAIASIIWQSIDAISADNVYDAMILGIIMVLLLIASFLLKKKMWFMLAAITLILQVIYTSRRFWLSIAWWVYLLVVGVLLIAIAAANEYRKRNGSEEHEHMQLFNDWNKW